jgi:ribosomal protein S27AE
MNFESEIEGIHVDLKYCERCGGLWLRSHHTEGVYCGACSAHFDSLPKRGEAKSLRRKARKAQATCRREEPTGYFQIEYLTGVAGAESQI